MLEVAIKYEFISRPTNLTYLLINLETGEPYKDENGNELKFVGKQKLKDYLSSNVEFQAEYIQMLNRHIQANSNAYGSLLDERTLALIKSEESSVEKEQVEE